MTGCPNWADGSKKLIHLWTYSLSIHSQSQSTVANPCKSHVSWQFHRGRMVQRTSTPPKPRHSPMFLYPNPESWCTNPPSPAPEAAHPHSPGLPPEAPNQSSKRSNQPTNQPTKLIQANRPIQSTKLSFFSHMLASRASLCDWQSQIVVSVRLPASPPGRELRPNSPWMLRPKENHLICGGFHQKKHGTPSTQGFAPVVPFPHKSTFHGIIHRLRGIGDPKVNKTIRLYVN